VPGVAGDREAECLPEQVGVQVLGDSTRDVCRLQWHGREQCSREELAGVFQPAGVLAGYDLVDVDDAVAMSPQDEPDGVGVLLQYEESPTLCCGLQTPDRHEADR